MNTAMLPRVMVGLDLRSDYERDLAKAIEARRVAAREHLERSERWERMTAYQMRALLDYSAVAARRRAVLLGVAK